MPGVLVIDYGSGNIRSAAKALERTGLTVQVSADPREVQNAAGIVIPGQGHFGQVMTQFREAGFEQPILHAIAKGTPILGICVGLQLLFEGSEEAPEIKGLGVFSGQIARFKEGLPTPQMQWNTLEKIGDSPLLHDVPCDSFAYFVHSYYAPITTEVDSGAISEYGVPFWSVISHKNVHATQFHPEKSQAVGLSILQNFSQLVLAHSP